MQKPALNYTKESHSTRGASELSSVLPTILQTGFMMLNEWYSIKKKPVQLSFIVSIGPKRELIRIGRELHIQQ